MVRWFDLIRGREGENRTVGRGYSTSETLQPYRSSPPVHQVAHGSYRQTLEVPSVPQCGGRDLLVAAGLSCRGCAPPRPVRQACPNRQRETYDIDALGIANDPQFLHIRALVQSPLRIHLIANPAQTQYRLGQRQVASRPARLAR